MLLSYEKLLKLAESGVIDVKHENINGASIDITLDSTVAIEMKPTKEKEWVDLKNKDTMFLADLEVNENFYFALEPGQFILASSVETFNLPNNIAAEYKLKSSLARNGLQHLLAGWCDPGWNNSKLTLEFKNVTEHHTLILRPGMKIGQMVFWECDPVKNENSYAIKGQYNNQKSVTKGKGLR